MEIVVEKIQINKINLYKSLHIVIGAAIEVTVVCVCVPCFILEYSFALCKERLRVVKYFIEPVCTMKLMKCKHSADISRTYFEIYQYKRRLHVTAFPVKVICWIC